MVGVTIRPGVSSQIRRSTDLRRIMSESLDSGAEEIMRRYQKTTKTWDTPVEFYIISTVFTRSIRTKSNVFAYVDKGTPAHQIRAKNPSIGFLQFQQNYTSKTTPNLLMSHKGGSYGGYVRKKEVTHPGIKARNFTQMIQDEVTPKIVAKIESKVAAYIKKSR